MYTLEDFEKAKTELARVEQRWSNYDGNNPNKYEADLKNARSQLRGVERHLKDIGLLPRTASEELNFALDRLYPNAESNTVVDYEGKKYQLKYFPLEVSRSGKKVKDWGHNWRLITPQQ